MTAHSGWLGSAGLLPANDFPQLATGGRRIGRRLEGELLDRPALADRPESRLTVRDRDRVVRPRDLDDLPIGVTWVVRIEQHPACLGPQAEIGSQPWRPCKPTDVQELIGVGDGNRAQVVQIERAPRISRVVQRFVRHGVPIPVGGLEIQQDIPRFARNKIGLGRRRRVPRVRVENAASGQQGEPETTNGQRHAEKYLTHGNHGLDLPGNQDFGPRLWRAFQRLNYIEIRVGSSNGVPLGEPEVPST